MLMMAVGSCVSISVKADEMTIEKTETRLFAQIEKNKMEMGKGITSEIFTIASKCGLSSMGGSYGTLYTGTRMSAYMGRNDLSDIYIRGNIKFTLKNAHEAHLSEGGQELVLIGAPAAELMKCMALAHVSDQASGADVELKTQHIDCKKLDSVGFTTCHLTQ